MATIYISLLDEGTDVWRPVSGERVFDKVYRITGTPPDDTEKWEFTTGDIVQCRVQKFATLERRLVAYKKVTLKTPTPGLIRKAIRLFDGDPKNATIERSLTLLFGTWPGNLDLAHVIPKAAALNMLYSTGILDVLTVAEHIVSLNIDARLTGGCHSVVEDIANVSFANNKKVRFSSFATKYCSWHKPALFPISDTNARGTLLVFNARDAFDTFSENTLITSYETYVRVVSSFRDYYGLQQFTYKDLDKFLWLHNGAVGV